MTLPFGGLDQHRFEPLAAGAGFNTRRRQKDRTTLLHRTFLIDARTTNCVRATGIRLPLGDFALTQTPKNTALLNAAPKAKRLREAFPQLHMACLGVRPKLHRAS
ncbi:MAG: hypothetical protein HQ582_30340 [Planctomycetes bacterium]|nr:hypothetical protein [Planctomycetota bacterium]